MDEFLFSNHIRPIGFVVAPNDRVKIGGAWEASTLMKAGRGLFCGLEADTFFSASHIQLISIIWSL